MQSNPPAFHGRGKERERLRPYGDVLDDTATHRFSSVGGRICRLFAGLSEDFRARKLHLRALLACACDGSCRVGRRAGLRGVCALWHRHRAVDCAVCQSKARACLQHLVSERNQPRVYCRVSRHHRFFDPYAVCPLR
ncbi:hypothetical protein SDC9_101536 [bioreactor metagenome]|uniref:Uncharacterized protein n=1 Tax=bioreactor metagenome TaxID=1076179 RepID=A0A645APC7_9ZZZZ